MEITEEEEEEQRVTKRQSTIEERDLPGEIDDTPVRPRSPITGPPVTLDSSIATSPKQSKFADTTEAPSFAGAPRPASPAKSFEADLGRRMSSQSSRQDYYSSSAYLSSKARVKLGPRPSADPASRPRSSGDTKRPVASMPAGLKLLLKGGKKTKTHDDSSSIISEAPSEDTFLAIPENNNKPRPHTSGGRPPSSSGISVKSLPAISAPTKQAMTPEKLRLMKALQLREKKKRESAAPTPAVPTIEMTPSAPPHAENPETVAEEITPVQVTAPPGFESVKEAPELGVEDNEATNVVQRLADEKHELAADQQSVSKADSAIDVVSTATTDHTSEHTHTDSRPPSPVCASEVGDSTKASSVSESTDETLQPAGEKEEHGEKEHIPAETQSIAEEQAGDVSTPSAELVTEVGEDIPRADERDAPKAPLALTQPEVKPDVKVTEVGEKQDAEPTLDSALAESSFIPTSKFASKLPSGQAAMDPMESRGQDPLNVANVTSEPGRIDEAGPAPVDTAERTEDGSAASPSKWNLPVSKYSSTHDSSKLPAPSPVPAIVSSSPESSSNGQDAIADAADKMVDDGTTEEKKRSGLPDPILTSPDLPEKEAPQQQNGDATDEQQNATNDDTSSSMAISPMTETPPQPSEPPTPRMGGLRTVSTPVHSPQSIAGEAPPPATPSRSMSSGSAFHQRMSQQPPSSHLAPPRQPGKLGGSLASRIKAFEQLASKNPPAAVPVISSVKDRPSSAFFSVQRNSSIRDGARSPSVLERTNSIYRGRAPTPADSEDSPESAGVRPTRERSGSVASRLSVFEGGNAPRGRPETVQVTARIVREPGQNYPRAPESSVDPLEYSSLELKQSPLIVDHRKDVETPEPATAAEAPIPTPLVHTAGEPRRSLHERRLSRDKRNSIDASKDALSRPGQRTSLTMARDFFRDSMVGKDSTTQARPPSVHLQSSSLLSRLSINTRHKSISQDSSLLSPVSVAEKNESPDEKKEGNRASRLMRRLSSTFSPSRKQSTSTVTSPILPEEDAFDPEKTPQAPRAMTAPVTPQPQAQANNIVAVMGDVNVQFPENLLWKRRTMSLDANGFLHLSPAQGAISSRERQLKRFHMSEFQTPYTPEMEFQELPNSVCLDFKTGSGLQIALQDRVGQQNVLLGELQFHDF